MNPDLDRVVGNAKEWQLEEVATSRCVCVGPCLFQAFVIVPTDSAAAAEVSIYDGQNDQGRLKCTFKAQYATPCCSWPNPAYFRQGLYVDLGQNVTKAFVQYLPLRD